jgi:hypothetical protein
MSTKNLAVVIATILFSAGCNVAPKKSESSVAANETSSSRMPSGYTVTQYPILHRLQQNGVKLAEDTEKWMKKWQGVDLEDESLYFFDELSGSTSINLKVKKKDPKEADGSKSMGSFVPRNGAANFNLEIAYFNMAAILGADHFFRPAIRYELGKTAKEKFENLIEKAEIKGKNRLLNKEAIMKRLATQEDLKGCLKAKKPDLSIGYDNMADWKQPPNGAPVMTHPVIAFLQAKNPKPKSGNTLVLKTGKNQYAGDELELVREYSVVMILDSIFQQWDRYSGGNIVINKTEDGRAHFYITDNGGADISGATGWVTRNLGWFSRYDRNTINKLQELLAFLKNPAKGYLGYTNAEEFVVDLGLYAELKPKDYVARIIRNMDLLMSTVEQNRIKHGDMAFLD